MFERLVREFFDFRLKLKEVNRKCELLNKVLFETQNEVKATLKEVNEGNALYMLFLLDIIRKYFLGEEIAFNEVQKDEIPNPTAGPPDSKMFTYSTGTISGVEKYKVYIKANYHGTGDDGLDAELIEFELAELMKISSIGELIEEKLKRECHYLPYYEK